MLPGSWPRDFIFVTETLALVAMERSGDVLALRYEAATVGGRAVFGRGHWPMASRVARRSGSPARRMRPWAVSMSYSRRR